MYKIIFEAHSGFRYLVMLTLVGAILLAFAGFFGKKTYTPGNKRINLITLITAHIQFLLGLVLYFLSPLVNTGDMGTAMKDDTLRYWTVEHAVMMLIAIALITVGHSKSKRLLDDLAKHRTIAIFYTLALVIIIVAITMSGRPVIGS